MLFIVIKIVRDKYFDMFLNCTSNLKLSAKTNQEQSKIIIVVIKKITNYLVLRM